MRLLFVGCLLLVLVAVVVSGSGPPQQTKQGVLNPTTATTTTTGDLPSNTEDNAGIANLTSSPNSGGALCCYVHQLPGTAHWAALSEPVKDGKCSTFAEFNKKLGASFTFKKVEAPVADKAACQALAGAHAFGGLQKVANDNHSPDKKPALNVDDFHKLTTSSSTATGSSAQAEVNTATQEAEAILQKAETTKVNEQTKENPPLTPTEQNNEETLQKQLDATSTPQTQAPEKTSAEKTPETQAVETGDKVLSTAKTPTLITDLSKQPSGPVCCYIHSFKTIKHWGSLLLPSKDGKCDTYADFANKIAGGADALEFAEPISPVEDAAGCHQASHAFNADVLPNAADLALQKDESSKPLSVADFQKATSKPNNGLVPNPVINQPIPQAKGQQAKQPKF